MALAKVKEIVSSSPTVVFSKTHCPYSKKVKQLLSELKVTYKLIELDLESDGSDIQSALLEWTGQKTVPNVFISGNHIGGCDVTMSMHQEGKLVPLLTNAGSLAKPDMALTKAKEIVSSNPTVVFSKSHCPYSKRVKQLLSELKATYKLIELDLESDGSDIQSALLEWTGQKTVPNVFIGGNHIGGCDVTMSMHQEGKLVPLLTGVGSLAKPDIEIALAKAKELVSSNPTVVFSKTHCPYSKRVKQLLSELKATYKLIELDLESNGSDIQSALLEWTGQKTVPNVFIGGNHIGGCDVTMSKHQEGKLVPLLIEVGSLAKPAAA